MKIFVAGTFDPLHIGHQWLLWHAAKMTDKLVIIVATDVMVRQVRNRDPFFPEQERMKRLNQEMLPNTIIRLGREDGDFLQTLREESPDMLLLGFDQVANEELIQSTFPELEICRAEKYFPEFFKSSHFRRT